jgi:hypothetical protein
MSDVPAAGLGPQIDEAIAVAIDGVIYQDACLAPLETDSEVVPIPKIGGDRGRRAPGPTRFLLYTSGGARRSGFPVVG